LASIFQKNRLNLVAFSFALVGFIAANEVACADTLQGGVTQIEAVSPSLLPGSVYNRAKIANRITNWYRIPVWLAGTRERSEIRSSVGTVKNVRTRERGRQLDSEGHIWEASREPIFYDIDRGELVSHTILTKSEPLYLTRNKVVLRLGGTMVAAKKNGDVIIDVMQWEEIHTLTPGPNNTVEGLISETRNFDKNGKLTLLSSDAKYYTEHLVAEFQAVDKDQRFDYKKQFSEFLHQAGKDNLIPP